MSDDPGDVTVTLQHNSRPSNGAGGNTDLWVDVSGPHDARLRNRRPAPSTYGHQGAGLLKRTEKFLVFDQPITLPITDAVRDFRFLVNGENITNEYWEVRQIDRYMVTVQVDVERVT